MGEVSIGVWASLAIRKPVSKAYWGHLGTRNLNTMLSCRDSEVGLYGKLHN
jgi:hypothetical protein